MKNITIYLFFLFIPCHIIAQNENWILRSVKDDISVYTSKIDGSGMEAFKGVVEVKASLSTIISVLRDADNLANWLYQAETSKLLKKDGNIVMIYVVSKAPWPVKNRDIAYQSLMVQNPENKEVMITMKGVPDYIPPKEDMVRIPYADGYWRLTPIDKEKVQITFQMHAEPGGSIPDWLANTTAVDSPYITLKNLRNELKKETYHMAKVDGIEEFK